MMIQVIDLCRGFREYFGSEWSFSTDAESPSGISRFLHEALCFVGARHFVREIPASFLLPA